MKDLNFNLVGFFFVLKYKNCKDDNLIQINSEHNEPIIALKNKNKITTNGIEQLKFFFHSFNFFFWFSKISHLI